MFILYAISSIAHSSAKTPGHSPGARIGHGVVRFNFTSRCETSMFGHEYNIRDMFPHGSVYSETGEECVVIACRNATSFPDLSAPTENLCSVRARCPAESNIWGRVKVSFTGRCTSCAAAAESNVWLH